MDGIEALAAYVPTEVRHALADRAVLPNRTTGAALFADISGFTPLSAAFADELGPTHGAEALTSWLDQVFSALITGVQQFRGSVIGFSGDAITCWFDDSPPLEHGAALRGGAAALAMQRAMAALAPVTTPRGRQFPIGVKLAVAAGPSRRFIVGDPAIQRFEALAGRTLERMATAESMARRGEVVVTFEIVEALKDRAEVSEWRQSDSGERFAALDALPRAVSPSPWPPAPPLEIEAIRPWLLRPVSERLERGEGGFLAAFKPVVALFLRFTGIDYDGDAAAEDKLHALVCRVQQILGSHGGHLIDLTMGDKGSYLFAAFGALHAHEDDARRAISAASALRSMGSDLAFLREIQIGVAQSQVYTGAYGCEARRTFGVVGNEVNVAARLMSAAGAGEILATSRIARSAGAAFEFSEQEPVRLKGWDQPLTPSLVIGEWDARSTAALKARSSDPLVGREAEQRSLDRALEDLVAGRGGLVLLEGEAGIGKSKLLGYALTQAAQRSVETFSGASDAMRSAAPYHPWRSVFECFFELDRADPDTRNDPSRRSKHCLERLASIDSAWVGLAPLLNTVLALDLPDSELTQHMEGQVRANNTNDLLVRLLLFRARSKPTLLLLEDLHWFDSASLSLLGLITREVSSALVIATRRPAADTHPVADGLDRSRGQLLTLERLEPGAVEALLRSSLGVRSLPGPVLQLIEQKAEGSPFFSQELAYALRDSGYIEISDGECRVAPDAGDLLKIGFPDTIQGVITSRIDSLPTRQQLAVKVASVIGRSFSYRVLHDVHPLEEDKQDLSKSLEGLERANLTLREGVQPELTYLFRHALTQEVAYSLLLHSQRQSLHRAVAAWYERQFRGDLSPHYAVLAHHMAQAARGQTLDPEVFSQALGYLDRAGEQALRSYSNEEAARFFLEAVGLDAAFQGPRPPADRVLPDLTSAQLRRSRWHSGLAMAYLALGQFTRCQDNSLSSLALLNHPVPNHAWRLITAVVAQLVKQALIRLWNREPGEWQVTEPERRVLTEVNGLFRLLAKSLYHDNDALRMMYANMHSLNLSERLGPSPELALIYSHMLLTLGVFQMHSWARAYGRRAVDVARTANQPAHLVTVLVNNGLYHVGLGEWQDAGRHLEEGRELSRQLGDDWQWGECMALLSDIALFQGDLARSRALSSELHTAADRRGTLLQMSWCMRPRVVEALRNERPDLAAEILEDTRRVWGQVPDRLVQIDAMGLLAVARLRLGDRARALEAVRAANERIVEVSPPVAFPRLLGYCGIAEVCLTLWAESIEGETTARERSQLERLARRACGNLRSYARVFAIGRPAAGLYRGWYSWLRGKRRRASMQLRDSLEAANALGMRYERAMAHYFIARYAAQDSETRQGHLRDALQVFGELNATREMGLVQRDIASELGRQAPAV